MELIETDGIVLKASGYKDNDAMLTLYTSQLGRVQAAAKGIKSYKNKLAAGCRIFTHSRFILAPGREVYRIRDAEPQHSFYNLSANIERLAYATYFADLASYLAQEQSASMELLRLLLNTFHLLEHSDRDFRLVRAVYELKLLQYTGFAPSMEACTACGDTDNVDHFDPASGGLLCHNCAQHMPDAMPLPEPCLIAMRYVLYSPVNKIFSFTLPAARVRELADILARFLAYHVEKQFRSLAYLNAITGD